MTSDQLSTLAGSLVSLLFAYVPGLSTWFDGLPSPKHKAGAMALFMLAVAAGVFGAGCAKLFGVTVACDVTGIQQLVSAYVAALIGMGGTYVTLVRPFKS